MDMGVAPASRTYSQLSGLQLRSGFGQGEPITVQCRKAVSATMALVLSAASMGASSADQGPTTTGHEPVASSLPLTNAAETANPRTDITAIPPGTVVVIEVGQSLASSTHKRGDIFPIQLVEPLLLDGAVLLPQGTRGTGEIVHAAAARSGGAPGELLIAARSLETPTGTLPLRGFKLGATGGDNSGMALGVSLAAGPFALFIRGREIVIPAGTRGMARTKALVAPIGDTGSVRPAPPPAGITSSAPSSSEITAPSEPTAPAASTPDMANQPKE